MRVPAFLRKMRCSPRLVAKLRTPSGVRNYPPVAVRAVNTGWSYSYAVTVCAFRSTSMRLCSGGTSGEIGAKSSDPNGRRCSARA